MRDYRVDAIRDISKAKNKSDLDKALKNLVNSGDVKKSKPSGPSSSIGFKQFSMKADEVTQKTKAPVLSVKPGQKRLIFTI